MWDDIPGMLVKEHKNLYMFFRANVDMWLHKIDGHISKFIDQMYILEVHHGNVLNKFLINDIDPLSIREDINGQSLKVWQIYILNFKYLWPEEC